MAEDTGVIAVADGGSSASDGSSSASGCGVRPPTTSPEPATGLLRLRTERSNAQPEAAWLFLLRVFAYL